MVKAKSNFNKDKVVKLVKEMQRKSSVGSIALSLVLLAMGVINIFTALIEKDVNILSLVIGIIVTLFSVYPILSNVKAVKNATYDMIKDMNLNSGELTILYEFKDKKIEISTIQNQETKSDCVMMKYLSFVKITKDSVIINMLNGEMYIISDSDFIEGDKSQLISLFNRNKVKIK